ncbi:restriction endonuclease subunit S [Staphylococcus saprophyticus]|nr:restriction endonuclease subunit S [Staphylococcus saprophyticus]
MSNYLIKIPSKEEQEKIGIFFLKFDELIDTQRKKIEVLKKQKNGFLQKMFV